MTREEITELAADALDAAIAVIRDRIPNQYTGDVAGHLFRLRDALAAYIRDELPAGAKP